MDPSTSSNPTINLQFNGDIHSTGGGHVGIVYQGTDKEKEILELIATLKPVFDAEWDVVGGTISGCLRGTRVAVLKSIWDWYTGGNSTPPIYWLKGDSGTGKSAIVYTSCQTFANKMVLGASFFFYGNQESRSKIDLVFITLAHRLSFTFPQLRTRIAEALKDKTLLASRSLRRQLRELILLPISREAHSLTSPIVIVIDALDECEDLNAGASVVQFIDILASEFEALDDIPWLKFLVTSRPHEHLLRVFSRAKVQNQTNMLYLRDVEATIQEGDLRFFVAARLRDLALQHKVIDSIEDWPSEDDISVLVDLSGGLFIAAATLLRMMDISEGSDKLDPRTALNNLRKSAPDTMGLDGIYREVLRMVARCHTTSEARCEIADLLAFAVLSFDRLAPPDIDALLNIKSEQFLPVLRSVITQPQGGGSLRTLHASFHEFMVDAGRCVDTPFNHIDAALHHLKLAKICLRKLGGLKQDLLNLQELQGWPLADIPNAEVKGRIALIPKDLCYAIRYWPMHVARCAIDGTIEDRELFALLDVFTKSSVIHWVEALSYLGYLDEGVARLGNMLSSLESDNSSLITKAFALLKAMWDRYSFIPYSSTVTNGAHPSSTSQRLQPWSAGTTINHLRTIFHDVKRLVHEHYEDISQSAMQLYCTALPFAPKETELHRLFTDTSGTVTVHVKSGIKSQWDACLQVIDLEAVVHSVAVSDDGADIAAGTSDGKIALIDMRTGAQRWRISGHQESSVHSVSFSTSGTRIASGSSDMTVRIWDARSGTQLLKLEGHSHEVRSVAFSPDETCVLSGSYDGTIRLWDSKSGKQISMLKGHTGLVSSVAFSPDGRLLISGSSDRTARVWDSGSGTQILQLEGHSDWVTSVSYCSDGNRIVSGSRDWTVRVWDSKSGREIFRLKEHTGRVDSVIFFADGRRILSASDDGTVRVWDSGSGKQILRLEEHRRGVNCAASSSDGTCIVSGSSDFTVRVWDCSHHRQRLQFEKHAGAVAAIAISPDGKRVATASVNDATLRIWECETGRRILHLETQERYLSSLAYSPDSARLVSVSLEGIARVWNSISGTQIMELSRDAEPQLSACFSNDGLHVIAQDWYGLSTIWDTATGARLAAGGDSVTPHVVQFAPFRCNRHERQLVRVHANGHQTTVGYLPPSFNITHSCFQGDVGVLGLQSGEVVILQMPTQWLGQPFPLSPRYVSLRNPLHPNSALHASVAHPDNSRWEVEFMRPSIRETN